jgi:HEPN domain-containing protein
MPAKDPDHWLYRFTVEEWLRAAEHELRRAEEALAKKQQRSGVAGARRAAGMAWNAVLCVALDEQYGRSYMEHLQALSRDATVPAPVRDAASALLAAPLATNVVALGRGDTSLAEAARLIVGHARQLVAPTASA